MNALNQAASSVFDLLLAPLEKLGPEFALVLMSGLFGALALGAFKYLSWQRGIARAKDRIKGHMIAIRIYQDDLWIVAKSVAAVLLRNFQYLGLNALPILPLLMPFTLIAAQFVVRYGFAPAELATGNASLAGRGLTLVVEMRPGRESDAGALELHLPEGLVARSPLVRSASDGRAWQEIAATRGGAYDIELVAGSARETKRVVFGASAERRMQPERVASFWSAWLWPAEPRFADESPFERIAFQYPDRPLRYLPDGPGGVLLTFFVASILFGLAVMKPLGVTI